MNIHHKIDLIERLLKEIKEELRGEQDDRLVTAHLDPDSGTPTYVINKLVEHGFVKNERFSASEVQEKLQFGAEEFRQYEYIKRFGGTDVIKMGHILKHVSQFKHEEYRLRLRPRDGKNMYVLERR